MEKVNVDNVDNCGIFKVEKSTWKLDNGQNARRVVIDSPHWVSAVVKVNNFNYENSIVMVAQFRYGAGKELCEFPCGMVEEGETALDAIIRECEEEIGLEKKNIVKIEKLYEHNPNPAFMTNRMTCFYIEVSNLDISKSHPDDDECLKLAFVSPNVIDALAEDSDSSVMMSLAWEKYRKREGK